MTRDADPLEAYVADLFRLPWEREAPRPPMPEPEPMPALSEMLWPERYP